MQIGCGYRVYNWLMIKSSELDTESKLWKTPNKKD